MLTLSTQKLTKHDLGVAKELLDEKSQAILDDMWNRMKSRKGLGSITAPVVSWRGKKFTAVMEKQVGSINADISFSLHEVR